MKDEMVCYNWGIKFTDFENGTVPTPYLPIYPRELRINRKIRIWIGYYRILLFCWNNITNV